MYRVLMAVDSNPDRALKQARYVASLPDAPGSVEVILLFVLHGEGKELPEGLGEAEIVTRVGSVRRATEYLEAEDIPVTVREDTGDTAADIVDEAEREDVDAIVLGGRKRSPTGKAIFGSVTQSVILNTDRPVVVTGGGASNPS